MSANDPLRRLALLLGGLSVLGALAVAATAGIVQAGEEPDRRGTPSRDQEPGFDYSTWTRVVGSGPADEAASYQVPGGTEWETQSATDPVSYKDAAGDPDVSGHAASFYYGNDCRREGERFQGAWTVLGDPGRGSDLGAFASQRARLWARGFGIGESGRAPAELAQPEEIELADGTPAVSVAVDLDMSVFPGACFTDEAELTVVAFPDGARIKTFVAARFVGLAGGVTDEEYAAILGSLEP